MNIDGICNTQHAQLAPGERRQENVPLQAETRCAAAGPQCLEWDSSELREWRGRHEHGRKKRCRKPSENHLPINSAAYSKIMPCMQQTKIVCAINCCACRKNVHTTSQHAYTCCAKTNKCTPQQYKRRNKETGNNKSCTATTDWKAKAKPTTPKTHTIRPHRQPNHC